MTPDKIFNKPLMMEPGRAQILADQILSEEEVAHFGEFQTNTFSPTLIEGVAVIPILGTLVNRRSSLDCCGDVSYQDIAVALIEAVENNAVSAILLDIDSGGGEANGVFDLSETIRELDAEKPIFAIANDAAFSGAYAIASAARKIFVTRTGGVGSIGVIAHHVDVSEMYRNMGVKITPIFAGDFKGELSPFQPLSEGAKARVQEDVNKTYDMFVNLVADHRGLSTVEVSETKAALFFGKDAVELGLADRVTTFDGAMEEILNTEPDMKLFSKVNKSEVKEDELETKTEEGTAELEVKEDIQEDVANENDTDVEEDAPVYATAIEISKMALDAGCASMIPDLLSKDQTVEEVKEQLDCVGKIKSLCERAKRPEMAEEFIKDNKSVVEVQDKLIDLMAADSEKHDVSSKHDAEGIDNKAVKEYASNEFKNPLIEDAENRRKAFDKQYKRS